MKTLYDGCVREKKNEMKKLENNKKERKKEKGGENLGIGLFLCC